MLDGQVCINVRVCAVKARHPNINNSKDFSGNKPRFGLKGPSLGYESVHTARLILREWSWGGSAGSRPREKNRKVKSHPRCQVTGSKGQGGEWMLPRGPTDQSRHSQIMEQRQWGVFNQDQQLQSVAEGNRYITNKSSSLTVRWISKEFR